MTIGSPPPAPASAPRPTLSPEFVIQRDGREYVLYRGLLALGHQLGLRSIQVELVQVPGPDNGNVAICRARVEVGDRTFTELGDASPANTGRLIAPHSIRMAATRAKARALRDAVNVGMTAVEELGEAEAAEAPPAPAPPVPPAAAPPAGGGPSPAERIRIGDQAYTREQVWLGYQARRTQALNAKAIDTGNPLAGHVPTDPLRDLVASAQRLRKLLEPPVELEGEVGDEDGGGGG